MSKMVYFHAMEGVAAAGGLPVMLPQETDASALDPLCEMRDGFLLTGGHDVGPEFCGQPRPCRLSHLRPARFSIAKEQ